MGHPSALNVLSPIFVGQWVSSNSDLGPMAACVCLYPSIPGPLGFPQPGHLPVPKHLICVPGHYLRFPPPAVPGHQRRHASAGTSQVGFLSSDWSTLGSTGAAEAPLTCPVGSSFAQGLR